MTIKLTDLGSFALLAGLLIACQPTSDTAPTAVVAPTASATPAAATPIAKISEIQKLPVFVRLLAATQEQPAKEGMGLQIGETIRTQGQALTQVDLNNGLAFRLAGDAVLKLQPDNRLNLTAGDMITWVQPGKKVPTEIITPAAVAGIRGTTVFVKIPKDPQEGVLFFAWEGSVAVRLTGQTEEVLLKTAEEVRIRPSDRDIQQIRKRVRRMSRAEWRQKRQTDRILRSFKKAKMPTLPIIDRLKPGEISLPSPSARSEQVERNKTRQQANDRQDERIKQGIERAERASLMKLEKADKLDKQNKPEKPSKLNKPEKLNKLEKPDKPEKPRTDPTFRRLDGRNQSGSDDRDERDNERERKPKLRKNQPESSDRDERDERGNDRERKPKLRKDQPESSDRDERDDDRNDGDDDRERKSKPRKNISDD